MLPDTLTRAIDRIYAAAEGAEPWTTPLEELRTLLRGRLISLLERDDNGADQIREAVGAADPSYRQSYVSYYWSRNIYMQRLASHLRPGIVVPHEACLTDREILDSEYYQDFLRRVGIFRVIAGMVVRHDGRPVRIAVCRARNDRPFSPQDTRMLAVLLPHFQRALAIQDRLTANAAHEAAAGADSRTGVSTPRPTRSTARGPFAQPPFTPAETLVADQLAAGQSVAEICEALRIRDSTARTHLRGLFQKTQTRRQAELVAWLLRHR